MDLTPTVQLALFTPVSLALFAASRTLFKEAFIRSLDEATGK